MNPRHYSQIERAIQCFDKSSTTDFLKDNHYLFFIFKKTERFVAALYILTELFSDTEPLKWELRSLGTSLGKDILSFREKSSVLSKENLGDVFGTIIRVASLLEIAHIANLVSVMNLSLFRKELDILAAFIEGRGRTGKTIAENAVFQESFFHIPGGVSPGDSSDEKIPPISAGKKEERTLTQQKDIFPKGHERVKDSVLYRGAKIGKGHNVISGKSENRKRAILEVLKMQNVAGIKDFSTVIRGCSEKTVQRELLMMVQKGLLKKEGERRWSRYSLV
jgi:hypothetical protein